MSKQASYRFSEEMDKWLEEQAKLRDSTKNQILRNLIAEKMTEHRTKTNKHIHTKRSDSHGNVRNSSN